MHVCINCGSDKVERQGDDFTCHKCQFNWDVALEQANQIYLRSQGRQPAKSSVATAIEGGPMTAAPGQAGTATIPTSSPATPPTPQQATPVPAETPSAVPTPETTAGDSQSPFAAPSPKPSGKGKANS